MRLGKRSVDATLLMPAERFMVATMLTLAALSLVVIGLRGTSVDWLSYAILFACSALLMLIGLYYRATGRSEAMANSLVSAACFLLFSPVASAFTYQFLPIWRAPIDPWLVSVDAMLGFHWPDAMALAANCLWLSEIMRWAYMSWLPQFALLIVALGFSGRARELHVFMMATVIATLITIAVWTMFPSFGTSTVFELSATVEAQLRPVVGSGYGAELRRLAMEGPQVLSPKESLGLIAAPSFHTVMAVQAIFAARTLRWLWPWALTVNLLVLPSTVIHGGHHLVDLLAGVATAVLGIYAAHVFLRPPQGTQDAAISAVR